MSLYKIKDFDPEYKKHFDDGDVIGLDLYAENDKIGSVDDIMVDDNGSIRYLLINTGMWVAGKRVLLPIGRTRIDYGQKRVYAETLTKSQVEALPELTEETHIDDNHEERVRDIYRSSTPGFQELTPHTIGVGYTGAEISPASTHSEPMLDLDTPYVDGQVEYDRQAAPVPMPAPAPVPAPMPVATTPTVDRDADMYAIDDRNHPSFKLYQERLIASKTRQKTGEAVVRKHVETETATASVPVEKERVVIERMPSTGTTAAAPGEVAFKDGEVSRVEVYEEVAEFRKEAFVREEVKVSKVVEHETATTQEQVRREEIDIKNAGDRPIVDRN
ncbi:DUF2382 domain-containing protein [Chamaesiphon polymorphus]|uniref:Photosystem reaction center subunit H n=1 Tax=Chamaesiphon polymorphus CCALA 037 TaxID=2107692 RepID=A0A2T1G0J7_9CYAN|nr:DUF2382 domain-containing protein [Chamaesiphon polymorphus]PSB50778.1 photosystem reaction center subunit H [Chamaesiphon polymorphus CCALA 037]